MKITKLDIEEMKRFVYKEPVAMLNPPEEYKKQHKKNVTQISNNNRVIRVNRGK